ncbi:MAG: tetratricopeptide repeat protein [Chloroflexota bacterium]
MILTLSHRGRIVDLNSALVEEYFDDWYALCVYLTSCTIGYTVNATMPINDGQSSVEREALPRLTIAAFGTPEVRHDGIPVTFRSRKTLALLIYLLIEEEPRSREQIMALLWPESDTTRARSNLRSTLTWLRQALGDTAPVVADRDTLRLDLTAIDTDIRLLQQAMQSIQRPASSTTSVANDDLAVLLAAVEHYRGEFLAGFLLGDAPDFDNWVSIQRELWHRWMGMILNQIVDLYFQQGDLMSALVFAERGITHDPLNETAYRRLMEVHARRGDRAMALQIYMNLQDMLTSELGITPSPETETFAAQIRADAALFASASRQVPNNLQLPPTPLVGRETDQAALSQLVLRNDVRLVTLLGPPGVGKTRMALDIASAIMPHFVDGVWFVDLTAANDEISIETTLARVLDVQETPDQPLRERIVATLCNRRQLLVLDGFEHVLSATSMILAVLESCAGITILVTSRESLALRWEHRYVLEPLAPPSPEDEADVDQAGAASAVVLFVQRAQAVDHTFTLSADNVQAVVRLCTHLDGLPLALELAAAQSAMLSPEEILTRITTSSLLPVLSFRDLPERHQTLQAAIHWSYELLDDLHQQLFRRLAVFAGGWSIEAAEAVANYDTRIPEIENMLASLIQKSLVQREQGLAGAPRYRFLTTLRQYAYIQLSSSGEEQSITNQHANFFTQLAERAEPQLQGAHQKQWIRQLDQEQANFRSAIDWACNYHDARGMGLRLVGSLRLYWWLRGLMHEALQRFDMALTQDDGRTPAYRAKALHGAANIAYWRGDTAWATSLHQEGLHLSRQIDNRAGIALALNSLGILASAQGDYLQALTLYREGLAIQRELGDTAGVAMTLHNAADVARYQGEYDEAADLFEESLTARRASGHPQGIALALYHLGYSNIRRQQHADALSRLLDSLNHLRDLDEQHLIADCFEGIAEILLIYGQPQAAAQLLGAAETLRETMQTRIDPINDAFYEQTVNDVRTALGSDEFAQAWATGRAMTLEQAYALSQQYLRET